MQLPIKRGIERIPGGMVIVPLALGATIADQVRTRLHNLASHR